MPTYGARVLGAEEHKKQTEAQIGGRATYGARVTGYQPHTAETPKAGEAEWPLPIRGMKAYLASHPETAPAAAEAELASEKPRKSALKFLYDGFDLDADLQGQIVDALKALEG